jgi:hypothetical protein
MTKEMRALGGAEVKPGPGVRLPRGLIHDVKPAAAIIRDILAEAEVVRTKLHPGTSTDSRLQSASHGTDPPSARLKRNGGHTMDLKKVEQELGEPVTESFPAMSKGYGKQITARAGMFAVGGLAGVAVGKVLEKRLAKDEDGENAPAGVEGEVYVALTANWLAIYEYKRGILKSSIGDLRAKIERAEIAVLTIEPKKMLGFSPISIATSDGTTYALEVAMAHKGKAQKVVSAVGAQGRVAA